MEATVNIHAFPVRTERPDGADEAAAEFYAREVIRELIRLHGRTKTEFMLSAWFESEASRIIE